ncbi:MAG: GGDEF domain-containing protein [Thermodesulfobacteriota bacterium]
MRNATMHSIIYLLAVLFMANLNAMADALFHPEMAYFAREHLIVGGIAGFFTALLGGFLLLYIRRTSAALAKLNRLNARLRDQTIRDGLTGLYNHRHFQEMLRHEFLLARRHESDLACLMLDLDRFKEVNDTYGHPFGDHVLAGTATLILNETRITDTVARYGGEEFAILLPNTDQQGALAIAERIRTRAENYLHRQREIARIVTISIGLATCSANRPDRPEQLLFLADQALYEAKTAGRNRVMLASSPVGPE